MNCISVVTTLYKSAPYVETFYKRVLHVLKKINALNYEIVFVNDASPDNSAQMVKSLCRTDSSVKLVDLSRNFGHHKALMAGLSYAKGELIFLIDSDLEEQPEWLLDFYDLLSNSEEADVVYGIQHQRKGHFFEKTTGNLFYSLTNFLLPFEYPKNLLTARLMTKRYVDALLQFKENSYVIGGLWVLAGFKQLPVKLVKKSSSQTSYSLFAKLRLFVRVIASFSSWPLYAVFYLGLTFVGVSFLILAYITFLLLSANPLAGWPSLMASIWFIGGCLLISVGILGLYIQKVFEETKRRPNFLVREVYQVDD